METRRFILALSLSLLVFLVYVRFFAPAPPETPVAEPAKQEAKTPQAASTPPTAPPAAAAKIEPAVRGRDIVIETDLVKATLNTAGGVITGWELKKYREADKTEVGLRALYRKIAGQTKKEEKPRKELGNVQLMPVYAGVDRADMVMPLTVVPLDKALYTISRVEYRTSHDALRLGSEKPSETIVLTYTGPAGLLIEKRLTFHNDNYQVDVTVNTKGLDGYTLSLGTDFGLEDKVSSDASGRVGLVARTDGKTVTEKLDSIKGELQYAGKIEWFGQADKYFTAALAYGNQGIVTASRTTAPKEVGDLLSSAVTIKEKPDARTFTLYAGPPTPCCR
ncbi:MAG TPA: membrane protein insertase YidC [Nitrospirota bacterium]